MSSSSAGVPRNALSGASLAHGCAMDRRGGRGEARAPRHQEGDANTEDEYALSKHFDAVKTHAILLCDLLAKAGLPRDCPAIPDQLQRATRHFSQEPKSFGHRGLFKFNAPEHFPSAKMPSTLPRGRHYLPNLTRSPSPIPHQRQDLLRLDLCRRALARHHRPSLSSESHWRPSVP